MRLGKCQSFYIAFLIKYMTTKIAITPASTFSPLNYHEAVRQSFEDITHRNTTYKKLFAFEQYITGYPFAHVFDTQSELDAFIVSVPPTISKLQCVMLLLQRGRYAELMAVIDSDPSGVSRILFDAAATLDRDSAMVNQLAAALGFSETDTDDFFVEAAEILV